MSSFQHRRKYKLPLVEVKNPDERWPRPVITGVLKKQGSRVKSWKKRFFILDRDGDLYYFKREKDKEPIKEHPIIVRKNKFGLAKDKIKISKFCIFIEFHKKKKKFYFHCPDRDTFLQWLEKLHQVGGVFKKSLFEFMPHKLPAWFMPYPILDLMKYIGEHPEEYLFHKAGSKAKMAEYRKKIDLAIAIDVSKIDVFTCCDIVKLYFRSLPSGLLSEVYEELIAAAKKKKKRKLKTAISAAIEGNLSKKRIPYVLLKTLFHLLKKLCDFEITKMTPLKFAQAFTQSLLRPKDKIDIPFRDMQEANEIVTEMITNSYDYYVDVWETPKRKLESDDSDSDSEEEVENKKSIDEEEEEYNRKIAERKRKDKEEREKKRAERNKRRPPRRSKVLNVEYEEEEKKKKEYGDDDSDLSETESESSGSEASSSDGE